MTKKDEICVKKFDEKKKDKFGINELKFSKFEYIFFTNYKFFLINLFNSSALFL